MHAEMTTAAPATAAPKRTPPLHAERATWRLTIRETWLGAVVVAVAAGILMEIGKQGWDKVQKTPGQGLAALSGNAAFRAIYGLPTATNTQGGFIVWRSQLFLMLIASVWALLVATRTLRGNEETGRYDLMLSSPLSLIGALVSTLVVLLAGCLLTMVVTASVLEGTGAPAAGSWLFGAGIGLLMFFFVAVGALTSQIFPERRRASGVAAGVVLITLILRMYADGSTGAGWVRWLTPFGWVEQLHSFGSNELLPLIPLIAAPLILLAAAVVLAVRRDVGAGVVASADTAAAHTRLLTGPLGFSTRRRIRDVPGWLGAMVIFGLLSGGLADSFAGLQNTQPQYVKELTQLGWGSAVDPRGWIAIFNAMMAVLLSLYAVACVHADYEDETRTRLDLPYSGRVRRAEWAGSTLLTAVAALVLVTAALGLFTWVGSAVSGAGVTFGDSMASAMNVLPVALLFLGLAMLLHGVFPSWTAGLVGGLAAIAYLLEVIGPALKWPNWVLDLTPYHHLTLVPYAPAAWTALGVFLGVAVVASVAGLAGYTRRDLRA